MIQLRSLLYSTSGLSQETQDSLEWKQKVLRKQTAKPRSCRTRNVEINEIREIKEYFNKLFVWNTVDVIYVLFSEYIMRLYLILLSYNNLIDSAFMN